MFNLSYPPNMLKRLMLLKTPFKKDDEIYLHKS